MQSFPMKTLTSVFESGSFFSSNGGRCQLCISTREPTCDVVNSEIRNLLPLPPSLTAPPLPLTLLTPSQSSWPMATSAGSDFGLSAHKCDGGTGTGLDWLTWLPPLMVRWRPWMEDVCWFSSSKMSVIHWKCWAQLHLNLGACARRNGSRLHPCIWLESSHLFPEDRHPSAWRLNWNVPIGNHFHLLPWFHPAIKNNSCRNGATNILDELLHCSTCS